MRRRLISPVLFAAVAVVCLALAPAVAHAASITLTAPSKVVPGTAFTLSGTTSVPTTVTITAKHVTGRTYTKVITAKSAASTSGVRYSTTMKLAYGGDYSVRAVAWNDWSSATRRIRCGAPVIGSSISQTTVTYDSPATFSGLLKRYDGTLMKYKKVKLYKIDPSGWAEYRGTYTTNSLGRVSAKVKDTKTWYWQWRYAGDASNASAVSARRKTYGYTRLYKWWDPGVPFTGKVYLPKGHTYQFYYMTANEFEPGWFYLTSSGGTRIVAFDMKWSMLPKCATTFKVPASGYYTWKITNGEGHSANWVIW